MGNRTRRRVLCSWCWWSNNRAWCGSPDHWWSTLWARCVICWCIGECIRMVYIRSTSKTSTRWKNRLRYDKMVNKGFNGAITRSSKGSESRSVGSGRISSNLGPRIRIRTRLARILEFRWAWKSKSDITSWKMECTMDATSNFWRRSDN